MCIDSQSRSWHRRGRHCYQPPCSLFTSICVVRLRFASSTVCCGRYYCSAGGEHRVRDAVPHGRRKKSEEGRLVDINNSGGCGATNSATCQKPLDLIPVVLARKRRTASVCLSVFLSVLLFTLTAGLKFSSVSSNLSLFLSCEFDQAGNGYRQDSTSRSVPSCRLLCSKYIPGT